MTYATGENCYQRTFGADGKPHSGGIGPAAGIEVFRKLGEIAAGFSSIQGERFGAPLKPEYNSAERYIKAHTDEVEQGILSSDSLDLRKYGITLSQLRKILDWVKKDAATQTGSYLRHGDLSPWNLLHDVSANQWTIVDGDDAKFGVLGEQIGVCLNSMRGNFNRDWIDALLDGYGARGEAQRREVLLRGAAYGTVTYGLTNAGRPWDPTNAEMCRDVAFSCMAPCVLLFEELT